ncbi:MAG: hypothetical protein Q8N28_01245 [bacterium]|nr:hypothetical protein [bacterium]
MFNIKFNINKILLAIVIILLIALGAVVYWQRSGFEKSYWAVYLDTGDLYFGKLSSFPKLSLSDVWFLQRNPQDTQNPLSLTKFGNAFWGPEDKIYLNEKSVAWKTKLREDSQVVQFIKNPQTVQPQTQSQTQPPIQESTITPSTQ